MTMVTSIANDAQIECGRLWSGKDEQALDLSILCPDADDIPELAARWGKDDGRAGEQRHFELFAGNEAAIKAYNEAYSRANRKGRGKRILCTGHIQQATGVVVVAVSEIDLMDADLEGLRNGITQPIMRLTDEQLKAIEAERPGEYEYLHRAER